MPRNRLNPFLPSRSKTRLEGKRTLLAESCSGLFWINGDYDTQDNLPDGEPLNGVADSVDNEIKSMRDLEDFTRLHLYIGGLQGAIASGTIQVGLEWRNTSGTSPSIKVYRAAEPDGGTKYLTNENGEYCAALQQAVPFKTALGTIDSNGGFKFPLDFWQSTGSGIPTFDAEHPNRYVLFEGVTEGKGQLVITFWKNNQKIGEGGSVWLDLVHVQKMYSRVKATGISAGFQEPHLVTTGMPPEPSMGWIDDPNGNVYDENAPVSWAETKQYIVFVHGWNTPYLRARNFFADTMFKRFWQRGYTGRFAAFYWPTLYDSFLGIPYTYNASEYRAWKCGESLKQFVNSLPGNYTKNLVAHSMGNIVGGSALRKGMSGVTNYAMLNAAVPAICYDTTTSLQQVQAISPDLDNDSATTALAYKGKLENINTRLVNFYLPDDDALAVWLINNSTYKPQTYFLKPGSETWYGGDHAYKYFPGDPSGQKLLLTFETGPPRYIQSLDESLAYVARSSTRAVGADEDAAGSIQNNKIDMTNYGFATQHSAEFEFSLQKTQSFYYDLLLNLGVPQNYLSPTRP